MADTAPSPTGLLGAADLAGANEPTRRSTRKRQTRERPSPPRDVPRPKTRKQQLDSMRENLQSALDTAGDFISFTNPYDGSVVKVKSGELANALVDAADSDERLFRILSNAGRLGGPYATLALVAMTVIVPILVNHDVIKMDEIPAFFGVPQPHGDAKESPTNQTVVGLDSLR